MARIFLAVPLPDEIKQEVLKVKGTHLQVPKIVWMKEENLHLTVFFIGHVPGEKVKSLMDAIVPVLQHQGAFELSFDSFYFAPSQKPRMLWAKFERSETFSKLSRSIHSGVGSIVPGFKPEFPDPIPHITLARFNSTFDTAQISCPETKLNRFLIRTCELWESVPGKNGVKYECRNKFDLVK